MKFRRHHNNKGEGQIRRGKTCDQVRWMAKRLNLPFSKPLKVSPPLDLNQQPSGSEPDALSG